MKKKNLLEKQTTEDLLETLSTKQKDIQRKIQKIQETRSKFFDEYNKLETDKEPDLKKMNKCIDDLKPLYKEYNALGRELFDIKNELVHKTGLNINELELLFNHWRISKILDQSRNAAF